MKLSKFYSYFNDKEGLKRMRKILGKAYLTLYRHAGIAP